MSLEELRAQAEAGEEAETEEEPKQPEPEAEEAESEEVEQEQESEEAEASDDFELELDGEPEPDRQEKPNAEQALIHKLTKTRKRAQSAETEAEKLQRRIDELEQKLQAPTQPQAPPSQNAAQPKFPDLYDNGIDGDRDKYDAAVKKYFDDLRAYDQRHSQAQEQQEKYRKRVEEQTKSLAQRAAKFSQDNKVSVDRVSEALEKATNEIDETTGVDGGLAHLLDSVGDGSERVAYYIGTNEGAMAQVKGMLQDDPTGFKAIAHMTRLAEKLRPKHQKRLSKAPEPDQPVQGDSSKASASVQKIQKMWDDAKTTEQMMEARRKAREHGVKLDT